MAKEKVQALLPEFFSFIARRAGRDFRDEVVRVMGMTAFRSLGKVIRRFRRIQQFRVIVQFGDIQGEHRSGCILGVDDVPVIAVFHDEFFVGIRPQQHIKQAEFFLWHLVCQGLSPVSDISF